MSMGATSPQRPLRAGEDVEDEAPQAADHAALPALPPAFRIHDLSRRWVEFQMADSFSAAPKVPARTDEGDAFAYASVAQPSVLPFTGLLPAAGSIPVPIWMRRTHICVRFAALRAGMFHSALSPDRRSEEHTPELHSLMRISYAVFCLK